MRALILISALLVTAAAAGENGEKEHPVSKLQPGHWFEAPDSHLEKVAFKWPAVEGGHKIGRIRAVMNSWCGGAYDTKRDRLIIWGGGHGGYAGNEIYVFDVPKLKWERINDPSLVLDNERGETYKDGLPRSVHTYDYIEYIPAIDRFVSLGLSATYPSGVGGGNTIWCFDFETEKWETKSPRLPADRARTQMCGTAYDPVTGHEFLHTRKGILWKWDPPADKWTGLGQVSGHYGTVGALDPVGRRYFAIGRSGHPEAKVQFHCADISAEKGAKREEIEPKGAEHMPKASHPGLEYDPVLDKIVGWSGGTNMSALDLEEMKWEKVAPAAGNKVTPTDALQQGTYGRFRYIPSMNAYIVVNGTDQSVYIYRLTNRAEQPVPKRFAEALKTGKDTKLVKYVADQVALWPKEKSEPVLKAGIEAQKKTGNAELVKLLEDALEGVREVE